MGEENKGGEGQEVRHSLKGSRLYRALLEQHAVPNFLMDGETGEIETVSLPPRAPTYDDLMAIMRRVEEEAYQLVPEPVHPDVKAYYQRRVLGETHEQMTDVFEAARKGDETRAQAKTRIMLEAYSLEGSQIRDRDLWALRAQYVSVRGYVQGVGGGLPYSTHNPAHFVNRYGIGGAREAVLTVGLRKDTVAEMGRRSMIESQSLWAMRLLGH